MALAGKIDISSYHVFSILGDGELKKVRFGKRLCSLVYKLSNLTAFVDFNGLQIDGDIKEVMSPLPIGEKFAAFNWNVLEVNGHDIDELHDAIEKARACEDKPTVIVMHTIKGKGVAEMEGQAGWHGKAPTEEEGKKFIAEVLEV